MCVYIYVCIYMYMCVHVCMYVCVCVCVYCNLPIMPDSPAWSGSCLPLHFYFIKLSP